jgi:peptidoglycan/LPS O-acetylase OafA/YrhL
METGIKEPSTVSAPPEVGLSRLAILDGWRAVSILLVLAAHMLPLGPKRLIINVMVGSIGMSLFFTLSSSHQHF